MPQLIKSGSSVFKSGNNVFRYNRLLDFVAAESPISAVQGGFNYPYGIAVDAAKDRIFVTQYLGTQIKILNYTNPKSGVFDTITQAEGGFTNPTRVELDIASDRILTTSIGNRFSAFNYTNPHLGSPKTVTLAGNLYGIGIDAASGRIFVCSDTNVGTVYILDYTTLTLIDTITSAQGNLNNCQGLAVDASGKRIFVSNGNGTISILNYDNPTSTPTMITGVGVGDIRLDIPNNRIFIANNTNIQILNYTDPSVTPSVISGAQGFFSAAKGISLDVPRNKFFVTGYSSNIVSIITNQFT